MIESLYQIDFISGPRTTRLLSIGDLIDAEIEPQAVQDAEVFVSIGTAWGRPVAKGGATISLSWSAYKNHASHAALRGYCMSQTAGLPGGKTGTLRLAISGGGTWDITDALLVSSSPMADTQSHDFETITTYEATGGRMVPFANVPWEAGWPISWGSSIHSAITTTHAAT